MNNTYSNIFYTKHFPLFLFFKKNIKYNISTCNKDVALQNKNKYYC